VRVRRGETSLGNFTMQGFLAAVQSGQIIATDEIFLQSTAWRTLTDFMLPQNLADLSQLKPPPAGDYDGFIEPPA